MDYYLGADGPTLLIFGPMEAPFEELKQLFEQLSTSPNLTTRLDQHKFIDKNPALRVTLACGPRSSLTKVRRVETPAEVSFQWRQHADHWEDSADLMSGFPPRQFSWPPNTSHTSHQTTSLSLSHEGNMPRLCVTDGMSSALLRHLRVLTMIVMMSSPILLRLDAVTCIVRLCLKTLLLPKLR